MLTRQLLHHPSAEKMSHTIEKFSEPILRPLSTIRTTKSQIIFAITPTYVRDTQKVDLTSLCQTIMHVQNLLWLVVEDSDMKTALVSDVLDRCKVESVQLNVYTPPGKKSISSGVDQRNLGLGWIRRYCSNQTNCTGSVYFMDDDNKYDLRLFEEIKKTQQVSVFLVGFCGGMRAEGPICNRNGRAKLWNAKWQPKRSLPIDMAGFAVRVELIVAKPNALIGVDKFGKQSKLGYLESDFLGNFVNRDMVECRGNNREVLVWHVRTQKPRIRYLPNLKREDNLQKEDKSSAPNEGEGRA
ncbi:galactosylgalactosylxylosylprotein 3-beta-glucuronosyltransferase sqv-8-like isoform X4 [Halichondria panicea]